VHEAVIWTVLALFTYAFVTLMVATRSIDASTAIRR
jgi:hypothetical protein